MRHALVDLLACGCPARSASTLSAGWFGLRHSLHAPQCAAGEHAHAEARIVVPLERGFTTVHGGRRLVVEAGAALHRPLGAEHVDRYPRSVACLSVLLPGTALLPAGRQPFVARDAALAGAEWALCAEMARPDAASVLVAEGLALLVSTIVLQQRPLVERGAPRWLGLVRERLEDGDGAPPTLSELGFAVDRDPAYVAATFKRVYGQSIGTTLRHRRLWQARACIAADPACRLSEVAQRCGFADQSHFARHFKRLFKLTPGDYLRRQRPLQVAVGAQSA